MKITTAIALTIVIALVVGWMFLYSGANTAGPTPQQQAILEVQDKRLSKGDINAPVKIVEYADILCPYCAIAHHEVLPRIESDYIDSGQVHLEVRMVGMIAPDSGRAAEGAYCAAEQDMFWQYMDSIYKHTWENYYSQDKTPDDISLFSHANMPVLTDKLDILNTKQSLEWQQCLKDGRYKSTVTNNRSDMRELRAYGTPHFVIAGQNYNGSPPYSTFKAVIEAALKKHQAEG